MIRTLRALSLPRFEMLYVLYSFSFPWRFKIGFSWDVQRRIEEVQASMSYELGYSIKVRKAMAMPVLYAYQIEQRVHRLLNKTQCKDMRGSGKTEWFEWPNFLGCLIILVSCYYFDIKKPAIHGLLALCIPIPIDAALVVLIIALLQYAAILGGVYGILYLIF